MMKLFFFFILPILSSPLSSFCSTFVFISSDPFFFSHSLLLSPLASAFTLFSHRWILPLLCGKAFQSVSLVIQQGATTGTVPDPAGATHLNGPMTTPWSSQGRLFTTGTKITSCDCDACCFLIDDTKSPFHLSKQMQNIIAM